MEFTLDNHFGGLFNCGVLIAFTSLSFDINFNLDISRNLVNSFHNVLDKHGLVSFDFSFNSEVALELDSALRKHADVFSLNFL